MANFDIVPINGFTQTTVEGALDLEGSAAMLRQIATDADSRYKHLLIDLRDATSTGLSYADVYRLVGLLAEDPDAFSGRIALLDTFRDGFEKIQFFEASATEKGYSVRAFLDEAAAIVWLETGAGFLIDAHTPAPRRR